MTDVEVLLREAMAERAASFTPVRAWDPRRRGSSWRPALLAAAAVVAVLAIAMGVGGHLLAWTAMPAFPGPSSAGDAPLPGSDLPSPPGLSSAGDAPASGSDLPNSAGTELTWPTPGGNLLTPLADSVTMTGTGTGTVELGPPPQGTTAVGFRFSCLTSGNFSFPGGAGVTCASSDVGEPSSGGQLPLSALAGAHGLTITTSPEARWSIVVTYVKVTTTAWAVNDRGQTYGAQNDNGSPDLVAVYATNGRLGYALAGELEGPTPPANPAEAATWQPAPRTIPVYESDGVTQIGVFTVG